MNRATERARNCEEFEFEYDFAGLVLSVTATIEIDDNGPGPDEHRIDIVACLVKDTIRTVFTEDLFVIKRVGTRPVLPLVYIPVEDDMRERGFCEWEKMQ